MYIENSNSMSAKGSNGELLSQAKTNAKEIIQQFPANQKFIIASNELNGIQQRTLSQNEALYATQAISELRDLGIAAELYPDAAKMGKQMAYADKRDIPYVVLAGSDEVTQERYTLKNLKDGKQQSVSLKELINLLS